MRVVRDTYLAISSSAGSGRLRTLGAAGRALGGLAGLDRLQEMKK